MVWFSRKIYRQFLTIVFMGFLSVSSAFVKSAAAGDLTISNQGQGSGTISGTVGCIIAPESNCVITVADGTPLTLAAAPEWHSVFATWGTPCNTTNPCSFTFNDPTSLTVTFDQNLQAAVILAHNLFAQYNTMYKAYQSAPDGGIVAAHEVTFHEDLNLDMGKSVTLRGGMGEMYLSNYGFTTILGSLTIGTGSVVIDAFIIQ